MDAEKCRFGFYSDATSINADSQDCLPLSGTYVTAAGSGTAGTACENGFFCLASSPYSGQKGKVGCPAGFYPKAGTSFTLVDDAC